MRSRRPGRWAAIVLAAALVAACGSQVPHDRIVAASQGSSGTNAATGGRTASAGASTGASGAVTGDGTAPGQGGTATAGGGAASAGGAATGGGAGATAGDQGGGGGARAADGSPVVIGNIGTYTGVVGAIFPGGPAAMQAWAQSANSRGGLNGHPVQIVSGDDGGDPARALSLARQMVEEQGAIALAGSMMPLSLTGIRGYLEANGIPLVGGDVTLQDWIESPVIFPSGTDVTSISIASVNLLRDAGGTRLAVLFCGESPSCGKLAEGAESSPPEGMTTVFSSQISIVQTDFTTECLRARQENIDAIFVAADANTVIRVGRSCAQQGLKPIYGTASIAVGPQLAGDPNTEGLIAPVNNAPWFDTSTPGGALFAEAMATYASGAPLTSPAATMFASGLLLEAASGALGATPTKDEVLAGMRSLSGETAQGMAPPLTFGDGPSGPIPCYFVVRVQGGQWIAPNGAVPQCI